MFGNQALVDAIDMVSARCGEIVHSADTAADREQAQRLFGQLWELRLRAQIGKPAEQFPPDESFVMEMVTAYRPVRLGSIPEQMVHMLTEAAPNMKDLAGIEDFTNAVRKLLL
jgi:hypothetical protein